ncbi:MAG: hypothetical protein AAFO96_25220 [Bacteroidota bacterium]
MANHRLTNRNQRTSAMLKVAGLYVVTTIILILIIFRTSDVSSDEKLKVDAENKAYKDNIERLQEMLALQDSLRQYTERLIDLHLANPGRTTSEISRLRASFEATSLQIAAMSQNPSEQITGGVMTIARTGDALDRGISEVRRFMENKDDDEDACKDQIEGVEDEKKKVEMDLFIEQQKVLALNQTIQNLSSGTKDAKDLVADAETKLATLKGQLQSLQKDIDEVHGEVNTRYRDKTWPSKTKTLLGIWETKLAQISKDIEGLSR